MHKPESCSRERGGESEPESVPSFLKHTKTVLKLKPFIYVHSGNDNVFAKVDELNGHLLQSVNQLVQTTHQ